MVDTILDQLEILIVEDSPTQALVLKQSLEGQNCLVRVAEDGQAGLEQIRSNKPHVVVSDIMMPRMDGFELCRQLKTDPQLREIPVILLTGLQDPMDVIKGIACGADSFLTKPCDINFLMSTMRGVLENKQANQGRVEGQSMAFFFNGKHHVLRIDQMQITNLLLSTYLNAIQKNSELEQSLGKLNQAYDEIKKKNSELNALNEQKNQFLGMAAHDLRNPLGVIIGYSGMLKSKLQGSIDEKSDKMLDKISHSSTFMLRLINDLLDVSVIESGKVTLHLAHVNLVDLIHDNITLLNNLAEKKQIKLVFVNKISSAKLYCDANKISQVLTNLVSNAIKFSNPGGEVQIGVEITENEVTISVKDSGMGISPEAQKTLFQPFTKGKEGTAGEKSTGLGLAIVHKIVTEHHGKIWVESEMGKGATFFVSLLREF